MTAIEMHFHREAIRKEEVKREQEAKRQALERARIEARHRGDIIFVA